ncbi:SpaA isopeptide-forming pilin-related protein, partial [Levilactobacillus acidifarinae]
MRKLGYAIVAGIVALLAGLMLAIPVTSHAAVTVSGLAAGDATVTDSAGNTVTSNSEFSKWENYEVSYNWAVPDDATVAHQSASVALPDGLVAANDTTIPLTAEDGTVIGSFTIKAGETTGTLTFNEAGENARNRKGTLKFYVKGTTDTKPTDNNWKVNKIGWVGSKNPDGTPTALTWNVAFNAGSQNIGTVTITDTLGPNQTFIPGSVTANTGSYDASGNFVNNGGTVTPTVSQNGQEITFTFANVTTAVDMTYQTKPNLTGGSQTWTNTASSNGSSVTANIAYGGSGTGSGQGYGSVVLTKTGTNDVILPGAEFELRDSTGKAIQTGLVTDAAGQITLNRLVPGDYTLVETKAPAGYDLNTETIPFTITEGATAVGQLHETDQATSTTTPPTNPG